MFFFWWGLAACAPTLVPAGPAVREASIGATPLGDLRYLTADGEKLVLRRWSAEGDTKAVLLALHGFGDHARFVEEAAKTWAPQGITTYAYDQRGFGTSPHRGLWAGTATYVADAKTMVRLLAARHPGVPLYLLGESMGGAVATLVATDASLPLSGVILSAPAVWARDTMPFYQRWGIFLASYSVPFLYATSEAVVVQSSDNLEMLKAMQADPLILKKPRVDAIHGLVDLMDEAFAAAGALQRPTLALYGRKDQLVPPEPTRLFWQALPAGHRLALYDNGWHFLLRDLEADKVVNDVAAWIANPAAALPSGGDLRAADWLTREP